MRGGFVKKLKTKSAFDGFKNRWLPPVPLLDRVGISRVNGTLSVGFGIFVSNFDS